MLRLLGSDGGSIGVVTFARFYAVHVLLLPPLTMLLIAIHLYPGAPPRRRARGGRHSTEEEVLSGAGFQGYRRDLRMVRDSGGHGDRGARPAGHVADPTDTSFIPRPEWYFLFLFQIVKFFEGPLEIVGTVILPTLAILALFLVPFIDRGRAVALRQRTGAIALVVLGAIGWSGLDRARRRHHAAEHRIRRRGSRNRSKPWQEIPADQLAAIGYFRKDNCGSCHVAGKAGSGPDLTVSPSHANPSTG